MAETLPELIERFPHREAEIMAWVNQDEMVGGAIEPVVSILRTAHDLGMRVHHFTTAEALVRELETVGLA